MYRWRAPSGAEVLTYREPNWYLGPVDANDAEFVPSFCKQTGMRTALRVYGVGDHGGGPTRRDILRIRDMMRWPIFPTVRFGTLTMFYTQAEEVCEQLPVLEGERNFVFTGCYTSQSEIKKGNFVAENMLCGSEALCTFAHSAANAPYDRRGFEEAWRKVLFNQFYDILPGSGVNGTHDHALGQYQEVYARAETNRRNAMQAIARRIDTAVFASPVPDGSRSAGAGVGFGVEGHRTALVERGSSNTRIWHVFNLCAVARREIVELVAWDLLCEPESLRTYTGDGESASMQIIDLGRNEYWQHDYTHILVEMEIPALGYATVVLRAEEERSDELPQRRDPRLFHPIVPVLENDVVRAEFDARSGELVSFTR